MRTYQIMTNGQVTYWGDAQGNKGKDANFDIEGELTDESRYDALRSFMLVSNMRYAEQVYIGHFNSKGEYTIRQYLEVLCLNDSDIEYELSFTVYNSQHIEKGLLING